jgi:hypothetical protein
VSGRARNRGGHAVHGKQRRHAEHGKPHLVWHAIVVASVGRMFYTHTT